MAHGEVADVCFTAFRRYQIHAQLYRFSARGLSCRVNQIGPRLFHRSCPHDRDRAVPFVQSYAAYSTNAPSAMTNGADKTPTSAEHASAQPAEDPAHIQYYAVSCGDENP